MLKPLKGKSTVTANLGVAIAQIGKKVIVVDGDMRKAQQHKIFKVPNAIGLSSILSENLEPIQAVRETGIPNLQVITCGPIPANPADLIGSPRSREAFERISRLADIVLVDSPPVLLVGVRWADGHPDRYCLYLERISNQDLMNNTGLPGGMFLLIFSFFSHGMI